MSYILGNENNNWLFGTSGDNYINGLAGNDLIYGGYGDDTLVGGSGDDTVNGGWGDDVFYAGTGHDIYRGDVGSDTFYFSSIPVNSDDNSTFVDGGIGFDTADFSWAYEGGFISLIDGWLNSIEHLRGTFFDDRLVGSDTDNHIEGQRGDDFVFGRDGNDLLEGGDGVDYVEGGRGNDTVLGGDGDDWLRGYEGHDILTGGAGADEFQFWALFEDEAGPGVWGTITDFNAQEGDTIKIFAGLGMGTVPKFIGSAAFSGKGPEVRVTRDPNDFFRARVSIDLDGDARADGHIRVELRNFFDLPDESDFFLL